MAYFPNAFLQTFVMNGGLTSSSQTNTLGIGSCGFYNAKTWNVIPLAQASVTQHPKVVFAMGSYRTIATDILGKHGGYKESFKSKVIDPNYVHRVWKVTGNAVQGHIVKLGWDGTNASTIPKFICGQNYHLRINLTGSPALRLVDHNVYHTFDVKTGCCPNATDPQLVDSVQVLLAFAKQINESPLVSKFLIATVEKSGVVVNETTYVPETDQSAIASLQATLKLTAGYSDTKFHYFSFDPRDHFELEPVVISSAQLVDDIGDPCSLFKQLTLTQAQVPLSAQGDGESVLREFILTNEYRQDPFLWDARKESINDFAFLADTLVNPNFVYHSFFILYSTSRNHNPSGTYDNDLCLLRICGRNTSTLTSLESWVTAYLNSAGTGVVVEDLS
jgi:hypothetical protein